MEVSAVITVLNEEGSIKTLLDGLLRQTKRPEEIIVVDGGSADNTLSVISNFEFLISKHKTRLKVFHKPGFNIAQGRNFGIKKATGEVIASTDAGCVPRRDWLKKLAGPFQDRDVDVVAGFYKMETRTPFERALAPFLGVMPQDLSPNFLPSSRSVAFRKSIWQKVGGYPSKPGTVSEDTVFNIRLLKAGAKIVQAPHALVSWQIPNSLWRAFWKFFRYASGDAQGGVWWHPSKKFFTHNIKALTVYARYLFFAAFFLVDPTWATLLPPVYLVAWPLRNASKAKSDEAILWLPAVQLLADLGVMLGFLWGMVKRW